MIHHSVIQKTHTVNHNALYAFHSPRNMDEVWVECVPNFSEGRDVAIINKIEEAIRSVEGVTLLDIDMGYDFNRTVVTMVGNPNSVLEAAILSSKIAIELIDMREHNGEHARMGAVDVVPFIPLSNATMDICTDLARKYATSMSLECNIPIYLYGEAAVTPSRVKLPDIRRGEYEGFVDKINHVDWMPDFGPAIFNPKTGVTATGSRNILIAYNVNLNTNDKALANKISGMIRTSGIIKKDKNGNKIIDENGKAERIRGKFDSLQAAGWMYDDDTAQVSMNLLDYNRASLHDVTETIIKEAKNLELEVISSELVGLVPLKALINAGKYYSEKDGDSSDIELINAAITGLKLDIIDDFIPEENIIEWTIKKHEEGLHE